uniref:Uncharacterized protein n=1 Tax=Panagrellus redivivus TaxID=6233 RepID=A0A7E4W8K2_PANRE
MQGDIRRRHSQSRVLAPPRTLPTKTVLTTMRHSASSPQGISQSLPASILKDGYIKAMSEKPVGFKEMRKGRRISSENNAYSATSGTSPRVTFDESMPAPPPPSCNHFKSYDAESLALRALRHRRTSLPVNTQHAEMASSNVAEARGLIVDMLTDRELPSNVTTCLKAVAQLLSAPTSSVNSFHISDLGLPRVVENPFSGEQLVVSAIFMHRGTVCVGIIICLLISISLRPPTSVVNVNEHNRKEERRKEAFVIHAFVPPSKHITAS